MQRRRTVFNRRRFCGFVAALPFAAMPAVRSETPSADYETGTNLLKSGREYLKAIAALERAVQAKPDNAAYQSALGYAYVARFASICYAARRGEIIQGLDRGYYNRKREWDKVKAESKSGTPLRPPPVAPASPATPDDNVLLATVKDDPALVHLHVPNFQNDVIAVYNYREYKDIPEIPKELVRLGRKSLAAFDAAHRLAVDLPLMYRAAVEYERGWGLFLLWREGTEQGVVSEQQSDKSPTPPQKVFVAPEAIREAFDICVRADEKNADYHVSLAHALVPHYVGWSAGSGLQHHHWDDSLYSDATRDAALAAFDRALALKPDDFDILYQSGLAASQMREALAAERFERAAHLKSNAVLWYFIAAMRFQEARRIEAKWPVFNGRSAVWQERFYCAPQTPLVPTRQASDANDEWARVAALREKALITIERANRTLRYEPIPLALPIPPLLKKAWELHPVRGYIDDVLVLDKLHSHTSDYDQLYPAKHDTSAIPRGLAALMGMGRKIVQTVREQIKNKDEAYRYSFNSDQQDALTYRAAMARYICFSALDMLERAQEDRPDENKAHLLREFRATNEQAQAFEPALWEFFH